MTWRREVRTVMLALCLGACGGGAGNGEGGGGAPDAQAPGAGVGAGPATSGSFSVGGQTYGFRAVRCDPSGGAPDGMLLRGSGSAPDGRRMTVELERLAPGQVTWESASVYFGSITEGNGWEARRGGVPDGRWYADDALSVPAPGPLINARGNELLVEAEFTPRAGGVAQSGVLRVSCAQ